MLEFDAVSIWPTLDDLEIGPAIYYADPPYSKDHYSRFEAHSLMGNYLNEDIAKAEVKLRHARALAAVLGRAAGRRYEVSYTERAEAERLERWRAIRDAEFPGGDARERAAAEVEAIERDMRIPELTEAGGGMYVPTPWRSPRAGMHYPTSRGGEWEPCSVVRGSS